MNTRPIPAESVDVLAGHPPSDPTDPAAAAQRMRRVFLASFIFAALAWLGTLLTAIFSSETNGIFMSWVAAWPTAFGAGGLLALKSGKAPGNAVGVAVLCGFAVVMTLWIFFTGIWPSL